MSNEKCVMCSAYLTQEEINLNVKWGTENELMCNSCDASAFYREFGYERELNE